MKIFYATLFDCEDKPFHCCQLKTLVTPQVGQHYPYNDVAFTVTKVVKQVVHLKMNDLQGTPLALHNLGVVLAKQLRLDLLCKKMEFYLQKFKKK